MLRIAQKEQEVESAQQLLLYLFIQILEEAGKGQVAW